MCVCEREREKEEKESERESRKERKIKKKAHVKNSDSFLTAMHRMTPPVAAGSEKFGTIVTVVSSAMKAICVGELRIELGEKRSRSRSR